MNTDKKSLMWKVKWTIVALGAAMLALWLLFYVYMHNVIRNYAVDNMEQVASSILSELDRSFLQLEEVVYTLSDDKEVADFLKMESGAEFYSRAASVGKLVSQYSSGTIFTDNLILYNQNRGYYRFFGNISNTGVRRLIDVTEKNGDSKYIQITLDEKNYIGYAGAVRYKDRTIGKAVMLTDENSVYRLFDELTEENDIHIALAADGKVVVSNQRDMVAENVDDIVNGNGYSMRKRVGFTSFELLIAGEDSDNRLNYLFMAAMLVVGVLLAIALKIFSNMLAKKFLTPIQKEMYESAYRLQEAEIEKQKALIISLKKQINAHFTVNVLNSINALSSAGENDKAGKLCDGLSYLLRYANAGDSLINGMEEFFILQKYTDIMQIRFPNRFSVNIDIEDYLEDIKLPRMLLQPIVENSIIHGFSEPDDGEKGCIHIYSELREETIRFVVEDNGRGMEPKQLELLLEEIRDKESDVELSESLSHVALKNIERRIFSYFGGEYGIQIESEPDKGTVVSVVLPAKV